MTTVGPVDPRPRTVTEEDRALLVGVRCPSCDYTAGGVRPRCPVCRARVTEASFGPAGAVWSATVVRVPTPERTPPYTLAYVDLDDGPRVLAHVAGAQSGQAPAVGTRVRLRQNTEYGDIQVEVSS